MTKLLDADFDREPSALVVTLRSGRRLHGAVSAHITLTETGIMLGIAYPQRDPDGWPHGTEQWAETETIDIEPDEWTSIRTVHADVYNNFRR